MKVEEPLCSENAALGTHNTICPGPRVSPSPVGSCECLGVTEGCLPSRICHCEGFQRHNFDLSVPKSLGGGIHHPGASSMGVQPLKLRWEMLQAFQKLTICHMLSKVPLPGKIENVWF